MRSLPATASLGGPQTNSQDIFNRGAVPTAIVQPISQLGSGSEGSVILSMQIDANGHPSAIQYAHGEASLAPAATSALSQWQFLPAKHAGTDCPSTFIAVEVVRASAPNSKSYSAKTAGSVVNVQH
jgi:outer membrane biosynthesis protein TonB